MFSKLMRPRSMLLSTLFLMGTASVALSGCSASGGEDDAVALAAPRQEMTTAGSEHAEAVCGPTCYGPCKTCIRGVCEDTCM